MGKEYYDNSAFSHKLFEQANSILGFRLSDIMFSGSEDDLKQTRVTQPAIFLHSIIAYKSMEGTKPQMVAGHSLGEFSALCANGTLSFEDAIKLVSIRAEAMQKACEITPSTMAAVLALLLRILLDHVEPARRVGAPSRPLRSMARMRRCWSIPKWRRRKRLLRLSASLATENVGFERPGECDQRSSKGSIEFGQSGLIGG